MKKLLSILAAMGLTATGASTVVSCSWGCSASDGNNEPAPSVDENGNVSYDTEITTDDTLQSGEDFNKKYAVYDANGNKVDAQIVPVDGDKAFPTKPGQKIKVKVTFKIPDYNGDKNYNYHIGETKPGADGKGTVSSVKEINVKKSGKKNPNFVGWGNDGSESGTANMSSPQVSSSYQSDGKGYYKGYDDQGKPLGDDNSSINADGYPVDTSGDSKSNNGFGQRIVLGKDGKAVTDKSGKVYVDNDGYRISYDKDNKKWVRVSADGTHTLGPDSEPNSGDKVWDINNGNESDVADGVQKVAPSIAPYVQRDKSGKVIAYLNANGQPVDPNGKVIDGGKTAPRSDKYSESGLDGTDNVNKKYDKQVKSKNWTLSGDVAITMGKNIKNGSITIGETNNGAPIPDKSISINPSDPDSHDWKTISSGKYAGMQARISDDGKKIEFRWPVSDKQIGDIVSGSTDSDSPVSKDDKGNTGINLPITFSDGKDGKGNQIKDIPGTVKITTPWDSNNSSSSKDPNATKKWWIDPESKSEVIDYTKVGKPNAIKIFVSKDLADGLNKSGILDEPKLINNEDNILSFKWDKSSDGKYVNTSSDGTSYVQGEVTAQSVASFDAAKNVGIDFSDSFGKGITQLQGTIPNSEIVLTQIHRDIIFDNPSQDINDEEKVTYSIKTLAADVDYSKADIKVVEDNKEVEWNTVKSIKNVDWNQDSKSLTVEFNDGVLKSGEQTKLSVDFGINKEPSLRSKKATLTATKVSVSTEESKLIFTNESTVASFNGYSGIWTVDGIGEDIDKNNVDVTVSAMSTGTQSASLNTVKSSSTWDGNKLIVTLDGVGPEGPKGQYQVKATFSLLNGFSNKIVKSLEVKRDTGKDINWTGNKATFNFGQGNNIEATLDDSKIKDFDISNVDSADINSLDGLDKSTYEAKWDATDKKVTITLLKEVKKGNYSFSIVLKNSKTGEALNPGVINTVKDQAMSTETNVEWTSKIVSFDQDGHSAAVFTAKNKGTDVDLSEPMKVEFEDDTLKEALDGQAAWNAGAKTLTVKLKTDIAANTYKLKISFGYTNGYDGNTSDELSINKDYPMDAEAQTSFDTDDSSFDGDKQVSFTLVNYGSDVDIDSQPKISLKGSTLPDNTFSVTWVDKKLTIKLNKEIPGGDRTLEVIFGLKNGYKGTSIPAELNVTKTKPDDDQTESVSWTDDTNVNAPLSDNDDATFTVDKAKTGEDIDLDNGPEIELDKDNSQGPGTVPTYTKTWDKDNGILTIHFEKAISHWKAAFKVIFAIGNGYISNKKVEAQEITVEKTKASAYEKAIDIDNIDTAQDFNETNKGQWHVSNYGPEVDIEHPTSVKVINTTNNQGPIDYRKAKIDSKGNITGPNKDANASKDFSIVANGANTADIKLSYKDGDLWEGQYIVKIVYKLKNYNESKEVDLKFSKTKANSKERNVSDSKSNTIVVTSHPAAWIPNSYASAVITIDDNFGTDVAFLNPEISAKGKKSRWIFQSEEHKDGKLILTFFNWKIFDQIGILLGSHTEFTISFDIVGFPDDNNTIKITSE